MSDVTRRSSIGVGLPPTPSIPAEAAGLDAAEVAERTARGEANDVTERVSRTIGEIIRANVFTRFNALLGVLCLIVLALRSFQDAVFGVIVVVNTVIGIVQEVRAKWTLEALSVLGESGTRARRGGVTVDLDLREVVRDDVLLLAPGDRVVVDGTLLTAQGLEVDESLLTGEADPASREIGEEVLSGSFVTAGTGTYRATGVGDEAYAARIARDARQFSLVRSELRGGLDSFLRGVTWFLVPTSVLLLTSQLLLGEEDLRGALLSTIAGVVTMVPEGLVLLTSLAFAVGVVRLGRRQVLVQELPAIEGLARVDTVCLDKTGTLTEPRMSVASVVRLDPAVQVDDVLAAVAAADPAPNPSLTAIRDHFPPTRGAAPAATVPFSSSRKWSAVTLADGRGSWVLGAPDVLLSAQDPALAGVAKYADAGQRVLLLASAGHLRGETSPPGLRPAALVVLEQPLRADAAATLRYFEDQGVAVKVLSGDNPRTVGSIAARLGLNQPAAYDGRDLPEGTEELADVAEAYSVFGRVTPHQKRAVIHALQARGHDVAMTGDGVNDVLALKDADIGVAMGNGSSASKAVAQIVLLESRFSDLPAVVAEGRRVLGNIERVAHLFLTKTVYACLMALVVGVAQIPFPFLPRHLTLVSTLAIGIPAFFLALAPNRSRVRAGFVRRVLRLAIPAGVLTAAASLAAYGVARASEPTSLEQDRTAAVIALFVMSMWVVGIVARPLVTWRLLLLTSMVAMFVAALAIPAARAFLALDVGEWHSELAAAVVCALVGVALLELAWRLSNRSAARQDGPPSRRAGHRFQLGASRTRHGGEKAPFAAFGQHRRTGSSPLPRQRSHTQPPPRQG